MGSLKIVNGDRRERSGIIQTNEIAILNYLCFLFVLTQSVLLRFVLRGSAGILAFPIASPSRSRLPPRTTCSPTAESNDVFEECIFFCFSAMQQIRQSGTHLSFLVAKSDIHVAMKITASSC